MSVKVSGVTALLLAFLMAVPVYSAGAVKIATVSIQEALNKVEQGKKAKEDLKREFDAKQKKLDLQQDELKKMQDSLSKQRIVLSPETLKTKEEEFNQKLIDLQKNFANYRQEIAQKEAQLTVSIIKNLRVLCEEIGKKEGYDLIVETSQDAVLYAQSKDDITTRVIQDYNKRYKGPLKIE